MQYTLLQNAIHCQNAIFITARFYWKLFNVIKNVEIAKDRTPISILF